MYIIFKILVHAPTLSIQNLEYLKTIENTDFPNWMYSLTTTHRFGYNLNLNGWTFVWKDVISGVAQAEYVVIETNMNYKSRSSEILALLRDQKINSIINNML